MVFKQYQSSGLDAPSLFPMIYNSVVERFTSWLVSQISCWILQRWNKFSAWTQCFPLGQEKQNDQAKLTSPASFAWWQRCSFHWFSAGVDVAEVYTVLLSYAVEVQLLIAEFNTFQWTLDEVRGLGRCYGPPASITAGKSAFVPSLLSTTLCQKSSSLMQMKWG